MDQDVDLAVLEDSGSGYSTLDNRIPVSGMKYTSGTWDGQAYYARDNITACIINKDYKGKQNFVPDFHLVSNFIEFQGYGFTSESASLPLNIRIKYPSGELIASGTVSSSEFTDTIKLITCTFPLFEIPSGKTFEVEFYSNEESNFYAVLASTSMTLPTENWSYKGTILHRSKKYQDNDYTSEYHRDLVVNIGIAGFFDFLERSNKVNISELIETDYDEFPRLLTITKLVWYKKVLQQANRIFKWIYYSSFFNIRKRLLSTLKFSYLLKELVYRTNRIVYFVKEFVYRINTLLNNVRNKLIQIISIPYYLFANVYRKIESIYGIKELIIKTIKILYRVLNKVSNSIIFKFRDLLSISKKIIFINKVFSLSSRILSQSFKLLNKTFKIMKFNFLIKIFKIQSLSTIWKNLNISSRSISSVWIVFKNISKKIKILHQVLKNIFNITSLRYILSETKARILISLNDIIGVISRNLKLLYSIGLTRANLLTIKYNLKVLIEQIFHSKYLIRSLRTLDRKISFSIRSLRTSILIGLHLLRNIRSGILKILHSISVITTVARSMVSSYIIRSLKERIFSILYVSGLLAYRSLTILYSLRELLSKEVILRSLVKVIRSYTLTIKTILKNSLSTILSIKYQLSGLCNKVIKINYSLMKIFFRSLTVIYKSMNLKIRSLTSKYNLRSSIFKLLKTIYKTSSIVSVLFRSIFSVGMGKVSTIFSLSYSVIKGVIEIGSILIKELPSIILKRRIPSIALIKEKTTNILKRILKRYEE